MKPSYETDLSDEQWFVVRPLVEATTGRKAKVSRREIVRREIVNAILDVARTGCQWRIASGALPVAQSAPRLSQVEHGVFVLPPMGVERHFGQNAR